MRQAGGRCCLQREDGLCSIHAAHGFGAKPVICQSFPYRFAETPAGVFVGLSFACTAVLKNLGPPLGGRETELSDAYEAAYSRRVIGEPLALTEDLPLSWAQYAAIEEDLDAMLDPALAPIGRRLIMQSVYLRLLINLLREARRQAGALTVGPEVNEEPLAVFRRRMRGVSREPWPLPRSLAAKRGASPILRRMFLGFAHALRNTYVERRGRARAYCMATSAYLRHALGRGILELPAFGRPVRYAELRSVRFDPSRPDADELLTRYFRHRLFRKDLLHAGEGIQVTHHLMLMHWGLIHWYGAALAAARGEREIQFDDLLESVRNVEKYYVFHSTFDRLFHSYPLLRGFLDRIFDHPLYAFSMGYPECNAECGMRNAE
jgi:hypothetical protein